MKKGKVCLNPRCKKQVKIIKETAKYLAFKCSNCGDSYDEPRTLYNSTK